MSTTRSTLLASVGLVVITLLLAVGCSSSDGAADGTATGETSTTTTTTTVPAPQGAPVISAPRQTCDGANLAAAAAGPLPGASLSNIVCEAKYAVATWEASPNGAVIVLFSLQDGVWAYTASGPVSGDVAALAPEGFSTTAIPEWLRKREAAANRPADAGSGGGSSGTPPSTVYQVDTDGSVQSCVADGDVLTCQPAPGIPPELVAGSPDAPVGPPSMFCKYNYNDPRCVANNQYTP